MKTLFARSFRGGRARAERHGANNRVVSNLGRCLIARRVINIGDKTIEHLDRPVQIEVFADLWRSREYREERVDQQGIHSEAVNKPCSAAGITTAL